MIRKITTLLLSLMLMMSGFTDRILASANNNQETTLTDGSVSVVGVFENGTRLQASDFVFSSNASKGIVKRNTAPKKTKGESVVVDENKDITLENVVAAYNIKLVKDGEEVQPNEKVTVTIENDSFAVGKIYRIIHVLDSEEAILNGIENGTAIEMTSEEFIGTFSEEAAIAKKATGKENVVYIEVLDKENANLTTKTGKITFETTSFSIYAIIEDGEEVARVTYHFQNADGTPYKFYNTANELVDNQILKNGEFLVDVGIPVIGDGETFTGWYIYENNEPTYQVLFGSEHPISVQWGDTKVVNQSSATITTEDRDVYVRPNLNEVVYVTFYEDAAGTNVLNRIQVAKGTRYDIAQQKAATFDTELAFVGWSTEKFVAAEGQTANDDHREPVTETDIQFNADAKYYPIFRPGHWIEFYSAPINASASYVSPKFVTGNSNASTVKPANPTWEGYVFRYWTLQDLYEGEEYHYQATGVPEFNWDQPLTSSITLYAYWQPSDTTYTVVYWQQNVSDKKDAVDKPDDPDLVDPNGNYKTYQYLRQETKDGVSGEPIVVNSTTITVPDGFVLNTAKSTTSAVVSNTGSTIINVFLDRKLITFNFDRDFTFYTVTENPTGTVYGYVDGQYVQLTLQDGQYVYTYTHPGDPIITYVYTTSFTSNNDYLIANRNSAGAGYVLNNNNTTVSSETVVVNAAGNGIASPYINGTDVLDSSVWKASNGIKLTNNGSYLRRSGNGQNVALSISNTNSNNNWDYYSSQYLEATDSYVGITYSNNSFTVYNGRNNRSPVYLYRKETIVPTITETGIYEGDLYKQSTTRSFTGLHGSTLQQNGYEWPSGLWRNTESGTYFPFLPEFISPVSGRDTLNFTLYQETSSTHVYVHFQNTDGSYSTEPTITSIMLGGYGNSTWTFSEQFTGFDVASYQLGGNNSTYHGQDPNNGTWVTTSLNETITVPYGNNLGIKYQRKKWTFSYLDSQNSLPLSGAGFASAQKYYGEEILSLKPTAIPTTNRPGHVFDGWYKDPGCTQPMEDSDWNSVMPNANMAVYAGWKKNRFRIIIDPNGGVLSDGESTFFRDDYGNKIHEYEDVSRDFVEDDNGTYEYFYAEYSKAPADFNGVRIARYVNSAHTEWSYGATSQPTVVWNQGEATLNASDVTTSPYNAFLDTTKKYKYEKGAYVLIGWYSMPFNENYVVPEGAVGEPYNFGNEITGDLYIQAQWRRVGEYHVSYELEPYLMDGDGNLTKYTGTDLSALNITPDLNGYADMSASAINKAPAGIYNNTGKTYVFQGWLYDGKVCKPGEIYNIKSSLAVDVEGEDGNIVKTIFVYPVYVEAKDLPVEVVDVILDANTGTTSLTSSTADKIRVEDNVVTYYNMQINQALELPGNKFSKTGYTLVGWAFDKDATPNNIDFTPNQLVGVDSINITDDDYSANTLYAIWNVNTYTVKVQKVVSEGSDQNKARSFSIASSFDPFVKTEYEGSFSITTTTERVFEDIPYGTTITLNEGVDEVRFELDSVVATRTSAPDNTELEEGVVSTLTPDNSNYSYVVEGDATIVFTNKFKKYTVTYYPNAEDATGDAPAEPTEYWVDTEYTVLENTYERAGYEFSKWNTEAAGTGHDYSKDETLVITGDVDLYAQWNPIITYIVAGPTGMATSENHNPEGSDLGGKITINEVQDTYISQAYDSEHEAVASVNDTVKYNFVGWFVQDDEGDYVFEGVHYTLITENPGTTNFTAKLVPETYYAIYEYNVVDLTIIKRILVDEEHPIALMNQDWSGKPKDLNNDEQSFLFRIDGSQVETNSDKAKQINMVVVIDNHSVMNSIVIKNLPVGKYKITEISNTVSPIWNWRYQLTDIDADKFVSLNVTDSYGIIDVSEVHEITFWNALVNEYWLSGTHYRKLPPVDFAGQGGE